MVVRKGSLTLKHSDTLSILRHVALIFLFVAFAVTAVMVVYIPPLDAHWENLLYVPGSDSILGIDIGLHDQFFFAWKRAHVVLKVWDKTDGVFTPDFFIDLVRVGDTSNGTYLHLTAIIIICVDLWAIIFSITVMCLKQKSINLTKRYYILSSFVIGSIVTLLIIGLIMRDAKVFGAMFNVEMNKTFSPNLEAALADSAAHPDDILLSTPVTCLDAEYTQLGIACISFLACYGGVCIGSAFYHYKELKAKKVTKK